MEAARNRSRTATATGKRKVRGVQRKPLADRTNAPASQSTSPADDVAATGSVEYTRRKSISGRWASLVAGLMENEGETLFNYSAEEDAPPPSMLSKSLTDPPPPPPPPRKKKKRLQQGSSNVLPQHFIDKQKAYFAEIDAFHLPVEVASSDELD